MSRGGKIQAVCNLSPVGRAENIALSTWTGGPSYRWYGKKTDSPVVEERTCRPVRSKGAQFDDIWVVFEAFFVTLRVKVSRQRWPKKFKFNYLNNRGPPHIAPKLSCQMPEKWTPGGGTLMPKSRKSGHFGWPTLMLVMPEKWPNWGISHGWCPENEHPRPKFREFNPYRTRFQCFITRMAPTEGKFLWFLFPPGRYHIWTRKRRICAAGLKNEDFWPSYMANAQKMADLEKIGCPKNGIFGSDILGNMGVVLPGYYEPMIIWTYSFPYDDRYIQMKKVATPGRTQSVTPRELLQNTIANGPKEKQKPTKC